MARWSKLIVVAALVVVLGLAAVYAPRRLGGGAIQVTGTIEALQVDVSSTIGGRIETLLVTDGRFHPVRAAHRHAAGLSGSP